MSIYSQDHTLRYCTYITFYAGRNLPPFYIGYSTISKVKSGYHGSVSSKQYAMIWNQELRNNPEKFKTVILTTHSDIQEAKKKETYFQSHFSVHKNQMYVNMSIANVKFYVKKRTIEHNRNISIAKKKSQYRHSQETLDLISKKKLGKKFPNRKPISEEVKRQISEKLKGRKRSTESRLKQSATTKGIPKSEEFKAKLRHPHSLTTQQGT